MTVQWDQGDCSCSDSIVFQFLTVRVAALDEARPMGRIRLGLMQDAVPMLDG